MAMMTLGIASPVQVGVARIDHPLTVRRNISALTIGVCGGYGHGHHRYGRIGVSAVMVALPLPSPGVTVVIAVMIAVPMPVTPVTIIMVIPVGRGRPQWKGHTETDNQREYASQKLHPLAHNDR